MLLINPALPLAHRANTDAEGHWDARVAALRTLADRYIAAGIAEAMAEEFAIEALDSELERAAAEASAAPGTCAGCGGACAPDDLYCSAECLDLMFINPALNVFGEPLPASADEALARQLVRELSEMHAVPSCYDRARYEAKSAQVRRLGFDIGPSDPTAPMGTSALCLYDKATQRPLSRQSTPAARYALRGCRVAMPGGAWAHIDVRGVCVGIEQAANAA